MRNFPAGAKIAVVILDGVVRAHIVRGGRGRIRYKVEPQQPEIVARGRARDPRTRIAHGALYTQRFGPKFLFAADEGATWARGWHGAAVDALRASLALAAPTTARGDIITFARNVYKRFKALPIEKKVALATTAAVVLESLASLGAKPSAPSDLTRRS